MNRRDFLKRMGVLAGAIPLTACTNKAVTLTNQSSQPAKSNDHVLKVVQQKHFIPGYDAWFDQEFVVAWGKKHGVTVEVTHVGFADLFPIATGMVAMQSGCDVFAFPTPPMVFEDEVVDLQDIGMELEKAYGTMSEVAKNSLLNPLTGKWTGISDHWVPFVSNWRSDLWQAAEAGSSPETWNDVLSVGRKLKKAGHPIGMGMSTDLDSNGALYALLNGYGAVIQDADGRVTINSKETVSALSFGSALFKEAMQSEILAWNASSNNQFMLSKKGSFALNAISITRSAEKDNPGLAKQINVSPPPSGPVSNKTPANVVSIYSVWKFSNKIELAKQFIRDLIHEAPTAFQHAELYNYPSFPGTVKSLAADYASEPKYQLLMDAPQWTCNLGYPASANAVTNQIIDTYLIPKAFSLVAVGTLTSKEGAGWLEGEVNKLVTKWHLQNASNNG